MMARITLPDRFLSVGRARRRATVLLGTVAVLLATTADAQQRTVSAWTVAACRMEIERRGWRIDANEPDGGHSDGWVWFRVATDSPAPPDAQSGMDSAPTSDALCGDAPSGGISLNLLSAGTSVFGADIPGDLVASCGAELERRGWKTSGGVSTARAGGTILVQHVVTNASGAEGVGHCAYTERRAPGSAVGERADPVLESVSAEVVRAEPRFDSVCQELFRTLGWSAVFVPDPRGERPDRARYAVTNRSGANPRNLTCRYDRVAETVTIEVVKR